MGVRRYNSQSPSRLRSLVSRRFPSSRAARVAPLVLVALVAACSTVDQYFPTAHNWFVYKIDVNQGNYLSQDMVDKLKTGQTKQQVRAILGTPLVTSAFRDNRWDYIYEFQRQGKLVERRAFAVFFVDDKLARWEGDEMPQSVAELNRAAATRSMPPESESFFVRWWNQLMRKTGN